MELVSHMRSTHRDSERAACCTVRLSRGLYKVQATFLLQAALGINRGLGP